MPRFLIVYDDLDAIERQELFIGSLSALRTRVDVLAANTPQGCKPPIWAQVTAQVRAKSHGSKR